MNRSISSAISSPFSSWRKWPASLMVMFGSSFAVGMSSLKKRSAPLDIGSLSEKSTRAGFSQRESASRVFLFSEETGASGVMGTERGHARAPAL